MSNAPITTDRLRILLAGAMPCAARILKLQLRVRAGNEEHRRKTISGVVEVLEGKLKLAILGGSVEADRATFLLSSPLPDLKYLEAEIRRCDDVSDVIRWTPWQWTFTGPARSSRPF